MNSFLTLEKSNCEKACHCMGVPKPGEDQACGMTSFSYDVLKIEMCGPQYEHFSVLDLPGLFRSTSASQSNNFRLLKRVLVPTPGQTTKEDMLHVRQMVSTYLQNPRSIILYVHNGKQVSQILTSFQRCCASQC